MPEDKPKSKGAAELAEAMAELEARLLLLQVELAEYYRTQYPTEPPSCFVSDPAIQKWVHDHID